MKVSNSKSSVMDIFGRALSHVRGELDNDSPVPEFQFRNKHGEYVFKWKTTPGVTAWWFAINPNNPAGGDRFQVIASNPDRNSGEINFVHRMDLEEYLTRVMMDILAREEQES